MRRLGDDRPCHSYQLASSSAVHIPARRYRPLSGASPHCQSAVLHAPPCLDIFKKAAEPTSHNYFLTHRTLPPGRYGASPGSISAQHSDFQLCTRIRRRRAVRASGMQRSKGLVRLAWKRMHRPIAHCCRDASVGTLTALHKTRRRSRPEIARARSSFSPRAVAFAMASCTVTHATILRCVMHARAIWEGREHARKEP